MFRNCNITGNGSDWNCNVEDIGYGNRIENCGIILVDGQPYDTNAHPYIPPPMSPETEEEVRQQRLAREQRREQRREARAQRRAAREQRAAHDAAQATESQSSGASFGSQAQMGEIINTYIQGDTVITERITRYA